MKKLLLTALLGLAVSVSMSAQIFVGGQLGINATSNTDKNVNPVVTTSNTTVSVLPNVGYILNDKMLVGARVGLNFGSTGANNSTFGLGLQPYLRYKVLNIGKFSLAAEANVGIATSTTTNKIGGVGVNKVSNFNFSLGAVPVVLYQLNEHIALEADINVLNFDLVNTDLKASKKVLVKFDRNSVKSGYHTHRIPFLQAASDGYYPG